MKHLSKLWQALPMVALFDVAALTLTSCGGDDEPQGTVIDYYINVEEELLVNGESNSTGRFLNPVTRMREAIRSVYPTANAQGADMAVLAACEKEQVDYIQMYTGMPEHLTCMFHLMRVVKDGTRVKLSEKLKTYVYDINPKATDVED